VPGRSADLDARYGRSPGQRRRNLVVAVIAALVVAVTFAVWVVWAGLDSSGGGLDTSDVGYVVESDQLTVVRSRVAVTPGTEVVCAVQVLDKSFSIVGWKVVTIPASSSGSTTISTEVKTTSRGVTGLINKCWIP